jgi:hypothetical protein
MILSTFLQIFMLSSLDNLRGLPLIEAFFDGNPFKNRLRERSVYVRYFIDKITPPTGVT